ncbi:recombinase family protein [Virgibacillus salexigens]|uniref:Recombinase RecB n=1 Tax=Virgibacillus kapii TaxID=1638645 RepID=A0ABQ2DER4_9BACI|nr:recombinase family protein [Virgibacillus kapii]GGJ55268.1 recombinase RecB [Virgibacillus kapii]
MTKRAAIYARVSTEEQTKGFSLRSQVDYLKEYLERKGYKNIEVFVDDGYSGKNFDRPNIQRLMRNLQQFDAIAVWKVDRLSRNNEHVLNLINNHLKPYDKKLLISTCDIDSSTANGYMFISLLGTFAEYERTQIIERVSSGMEKRAKSGKWNGGKVLGYDSTNGVLSVNDEESLVVKEIFELRANGKGYKSIVNHINTKGYRTKKGNPFGINSIKTILENPIYAGFIRWGKFKNWSEKRRGGKQSNIELVKGEHPAIIDEELWERVQLITREHKEKFPKTSNFEGEFVLSGILKCPQCGKGMVMSKSKKRNSDDYYLYYQCQNFHQKGLAACNSNLIVKEDIEKKVLQRIKGLLTHPQIISGILENIDRERTEGVQESVSELEFLKSEYKEKESEEASLIARVRRAIKNNDEDGERSYNSIISKVVEEKEKIEKQIEEYNIYIKNHSTSLNIDEGLILQALEDFNGLYEIADNKTRKFLLRSLIKKIEVQNDRETIESMTLWFEEGNNLPSSPSLFFGDVLPVNDVRRTVS